MYEKMQVLTRGFLLYFDRSELQFVGQETMTELRFGLNYRIQGKFSRYIRWGGSVAR